MAKNQIKNKKSIIAFDGGKCSFKQKFYQEIEKLPTCLHI